MEQHLERALIELYYALAELERARQSADWRGNPDQSQSLFDAMRLTRWGLKTALRSLSKIRAAQSNDAAH
jgi:hypothetical protein